MIFNENSGLVIVWVRLIKNPNNNFSINDVPDISNLKEIVEQILNRDKGENENGEQ